MTNLQIAKKMEDMTVTQLFRFYKLQKGSTPKISDIVIYIHDVVRQKKRRERIFEKIYWGYYERRKFRHAYRTIEIDRKRALQTVIENINRLASGDNYAKFPFMGFTNLYMCHPYYGHSDYNKYILLPLHGNYNFCKWIVDYANKKINQCGE